MKKEETIANTLPDWSWPFDVSRYDRGAALSPAETAALKEYAHNYTAATHIKPPDFYAIVQRLILPLEDVLIYTGLRTTLREFTILFLLREMARRDRSFWGWSEEEWVETINSRWQEQQHVIAIAYLLCSFSRLEAVGGVHLVYIALARKIFGDQRIEAEVARVQETLTRWGHKPIYVKQYMQRTVCEAFLFNRSPDLEDLTTNLLLSLKGKRISRDPAKCLVALSRVLVSLGVLERPLPIEKPSREKLGYRSLTEGVSAEWARLTQYWFDTSTLTRHVRRRNYYFLLNVRRWLAVKHPEIFSPEQWTRDLAAECVAMVCEMKCGEWAERKDCCNQPVGKLLAPTTRASRLSALRAFFRDLQEWGLITLLCRKAGVAAADLRGNITSHRARSTIASQLYNAKEPMSLFELQAWLGHSSPSATQHYAKIMPTKLAKSYADAGYFGRNLRAVEVLIDQTAIANGAAMAGEPWRFYDLGHGYCSYDFFDQCPHRMACAKCAFYLPKASSRVQLLEAKENLLRLKQEIPLWDEECAAVEEGIEFMEKLCRQLADVPTPAGPTPRELGAPDRRELPIVSAQSEPRAARPSGQSHKR